MAEPRRRKLKLTDTPLAEPEDLVHQLASETQNYLYFPDPSALYVTLGAVAGNMLKGNPIWLILVGPGGSGKTEILEMFTNMPNTRVVSNIKSPAVLLSGTGKKEITAKATGGLLRELGLYGTLIMTDMSGMLKLPRDPLGEVLAAFRDIYGGRWVRPIGTEGGRSLVWGPLKPGDPFGKLTFLGASTPAIDRHHQLNAELGERWIYYRFPDSDSHGETQSALRNKDPQENRELMRQNVANFFSAAELSMTNLKEARYFTASEEMRLEAMAMLSVKLRSDVPRDYYSKEVIDMVDAERPQRLATVLGQLYLGLEAIGLPEEERWPLIGKVALDSTPRLRSEIVRALKQTEAGLSVHELARWTRLTQSEKTVARAVEDLEIYGVVEVERTRKAKIGKNSTESESNNESEPSHNTGARVVLSQWAVDLIRLGWDNNQRSIEND